MTELFFPILIISLGILFLELQYRTRARSPLSLTFQSWKVTQKGQEIVAKGVIKISNDHSLMEVMVPEFRANIKLLGKRDLNSLYKEIRITPCHPDEDSRDDGYWVAYIVKSLKQTYVEIEITIKDKSQTSQINFLDNIWIEIHWINYGPFGLIKRRDGLLVPIKKVEKIKASDANFIKEKYYSILPIRTHLLGVLDSPKEVIKQYASNIVEPGDLITIGETPLAIMQGRYIHPSTITPSWLSKILCKAFHPTSSLATACGLQTLIDLVGPTRVIFSWGIGAALKVIGIKGGFYRFAGEQARLIDDITGTTPPYDQTIVLGPERQNQICEEIAEEIGVSVAIVDVNDLGRVKVVASSKHCEERLLMTALRNNPAGNANQQTPIVLVRPNHNISNTTNQ